MGEPEMKVPTIEKYRAPTALHKFEWFKFLKAERSKYVWVCCRCLASTRSIRTFNFIKILWLQNDWKMVNNIDQIVRTLLTQNNAQLAFHVSQELYDIIFHTNTKDFQSHGNKCAVNVSHPWKIVFSLLIWVRSHLSFDQCFRAFFSHFVAMKFL